MSSTYDPANEQGKVRLLISDTDVDDVVFEDAEIGAFLALGGSGGGKVFRAAALALRAIASNEVQVLKVMRLMDLQTDGRAVAQALRELAKEYDLTAKAPAGRGQFAIAELAIEPFGLQDRIYKEVQRASG